MQHCRRLVAVASVVALFAATVAASAAPAEQANAPAIVYSDMYLKLIAAFPSGWVTDSCAAVLQVTARTGVCSDTLQLQYFYPDGRFGKMPWYVDAASTTGWSVEPDPCIALTDDEYALWSAYVDFHGGYLDSGPDLTPEQVDLYGTCWGWWF